MYFLRPGDGKPSGWPSRALAAWSAQGPSATQPLKQWVALRPAPLKTPCVIWWKGRGHWGHRLLIPLRIWNCSGIRWASLGRGSLSMRYGTGSLVLYSVISLYIFCYMYILCYGLPYVWDWLAPSWLFSDVRATKMSGVW